MTLAAGEGRVEAESLTIGPFRGSPDEWDTFVCRQKDWTHFHRFGWKSVVSQTLGHECPYLEARDSQGGLRGILPLVRVRSRLFGHYLVSMPFLNYGGPLGSDEAVAGLARRAAVLAARDRVTLLELRSRNPRPLGMPVSHHKVTVLLELPAGDPDLLWKNLPAKVRSQVRRPRKAGIEVHFGLDQVGPFWEVFSRHMRDLGTPTHARRLFEVIARTFPQDVWFGCAYKDRRPVACGAGFRWEDEFEMTWASALSEYSRMAPNMLLYWSFMERAIEQGVRRFNFGRCTPGSGTHRFKLQWGGSDEPLWWYRSAADPSVTTPSPDDARFSWGPAIWRRLPLSVANRLGPRVVRFLP